MFGFSANSRREEWASAPIYASRGDDPLIEELKVARIPVDLARIVSFCRKHHIRRLSLFGSVLREDFDADSDVDVLVEFDSRYIPGLEFFAMETELSEILGRKVDLNTSGFVSPYFRDQVLAEAEVQYVEGE